MGLWQNFKLKGELNVNIHALLIAHRELANLVVKSKSDWWSSALASVNRGERIGDVTAFVVIEQIRKGLLRDRESIDTVRQNLHATGSFDDLLVANQAIVSMISVANTLKGKGDDYSASIDYLIARTYGQILTADPDEQNYIVQKLQTYAGIFQKDMYDAVRSAQNASPPPLPDPFSVESKYLDIIQSKVTGFVETRYRNCTDRMLSIYRSRLDQIEDKSVNAMDLVEAETNLLLQEILNSNRWAWNEARALTDEDLNQVDNLFNAKDVAERHIGEKFADLIEFTVEGHTKQLVQQVASLRLEKLDRIAKSRFT